MIYTHGDVLQTHLKFIAHQVNCKGVMGRGLAKQISDTYPQVLDLYKQYINKYYEEHGHSPLGTAFCTFVGYSCDDSEQCIINIFGQEGFGTDRQYTDYEAVKKAFENFDIDYRYNTGFDGQIVIAIPYGFGCGLGGGRWDKMEETLKYIEDNYNIEFVVYKQN